MCSLIPALETDNSERKAIPTFFLLLKLAIPSVHPFSIWKLCEYILILSFSDTIDKIVSSKVDMVRLGTKFSEQKCADYSWEN